MKTSLTLIIIHWNTPELLRQQLTLFKNDQQWPIVVIDNHSDQNINRLVKQFSQAKLIENQKNIGFAAACNQGTRLAKSDWLLFLNPDVLILPATVKRMINFAQKNQLDASSPHSNQDGYEKPLPSFWRLVLEFSPLKFLTGLFVSKKTLTGGALLIRKMVLDTIGGWDERFFLWFEDSDLTQRLYRAGFKIGWYPETIKHLGGKSLKQLPENKQRQLFFQSMDLYAQKHFSWLAQKLLYFWTKRFWQT